MKKKSRSKRPARKKRLSPAQKPKGTLIKQLGLLLVFCGTIYIYFSIPFYRAWIESRILPYYKQMPHQIKTMDLEKRLTERHQYNYLIPKMIREQTSDSSVVLFPSRAYTQKNFSRDFYSWHHPIWNYYFFGPGNYVLFNKEIVQDFSGVTHAVYCEEGRIRLIEIDAPEKLTAVLESYREPE